MTHTRQRDPRPLNEFTEDQFRQLEEMAAYKRERDRVSRMTANEWFNEELARTAAKYGPNPK